MFPVLKKSLVGIIIRGGTMIPIRRGQHPKAYLEVHGTF